jgi:hypothetical protein
LWRVAWNALNSTRRVIILSKRASRETSGTAVEVVEAVEAVDTVEASETTGGGVTGAGVGVEAAVVAVLAEADFPEVLVFLALAAVFEVFGFEVLAGMV